MNKPGFTSSRLLYKKAEEKDIVYIKALENHRDNRPFVLSDTHQDHLKHIQDPDYWLLIIQEKNSQNNIGFILAHLDRKSNSLEFRRFVIEIKGMSYGREALLAFIGYSFNKLKVNRFWLDVYAYNQVGLKLYTSIGMVEEAHFRQAYLIDSSYQDQIIFSILKSEYETLPIFR